MSNPWSPFYWRDYVADTGHLTLAEHGAYLLLMAHYYMTGKPIPSDPKQLRRIGRARTRKDASIIGRILVEFFTRDGHSYRHARIDRELARFNDISQKRANAARSKHARAQQMQSAGNANAMHMDTQPQPQPQKDRNSSSEQSSDGVEILTPKKTAKEPSKEASKLAALLKAEILRNKADYRITPAQERKWAVTAERMLRLDGRTPEQITDLIQWVQRDEFWMCNVLSMDSLREKFDQLELKRGKSPPSPAAFTNQKPVRAVDEARRLLAVDDSGEASGVSN